MLEYFKPKRNFDCAIIFKDCQEMFDFLLDEWFTCQITKLMEDKYVTNIDIDDFYNALSKEELAKRKTNFARHAIKKADFIKYEG